MRNSPDGVAAPVIFEGFVVFPVVLQRFPQCEGQMRLVIGVAALGRYLLAHVVDVFVAEAERLQVGQAPIGLAYLGTQTDAFIVGLDGFIQPSHRF